MKIPLVDLRRQFRSIEGELRAAVERVFDGSEFSMGEDILAFEQEFAEYCGVKNVIGVSSGTDALVLALRAAGISPGDEVITVPFTFAATAEAILTVGARPIFIDVDPETGVLSSEGLEPALTPRTRAIIPVHLYGYPCEMATIGEFARKHGLRVIEDAAQAHGADFRGRRVGSLGDLGCFSFYPAKNLGAMGEAGAVATGDDQWAESLRLMRNHGSREKYRHVCAGWNCRMDTLQAAVLRVKLRHLEEWNRRRRQLAGLYTHLLSGLEDLYLPQPCPYGREVFHLYVIRTPHRDLLRDSLSAQGIATGIHYPFPLHFQPGFSALGYKAGDFPAAERLAREVLSLPIFPEMEESEVESIAAAVRALLRGATSRRIAT